MFLPGPDWDKAGIQAGCGFSFGLMPFFAAMLTQVQSRQPFCADTKTFIVGLSRLYFVGLGMLRLLGKVIATRYSGHFLHILPFCSIF